MHGEIPKWGTISISAHHTAEAGAPPARETAFIPADAHAPSLSP
ncbi:methylmalonyl-CoA mutase family protein [Streptomyces mirabilis]